MKTLVKILRGVLIATMLIVLAIPACIMGALLKGERKDSFLYLVSENINKIMHSIE